MPGHNGTSDAIRAVLMRGGAYSIKELTQAIVEAGNADATEIGVLPALHLATPTPTTMHVPASANR